MTALFLHGGPGAGCFPNHVRFFSPQLYETVVLLDQRGCGRSTPRGRVEENTLELLVGDVERLRVHLLEKNEEEEDIVVGEDATISTSLSISSSAIRPWDVILGGSWGCTLTLAYAHTYPKHVRAMVLRGVCLFRPREIDWLFGDPPPPPPPPSSFTSITTKTSNLRSLLTGVGVGNHRVCDGVDDGASPMDATTTSNSMTTASTIFPGEWEEFRKGSSIGNFSGNADVGSTDSSAMGEWVLRNENNYRRKILHRYYKLLLGSDPILRFNATRSWIRWEMGIYSSGFRGMKQVSDNISTEHDKYSVLIWNPHARSWVYEDARVYGNQSFVPISHLHSASSSSKSVSTQILMTDDLNGLTQSLRRFTSYPSPTLSSSPPEPMSVRSPAASSGKSLNDSISTTNVTSSARSTNSTSDPTGIIPAQAMLTCYYSTNDDYCIGRYRPFLSLEPPTLSMSMSPWYSSNLPPLVPHTSDPSQPQPTASATMCYPLPPTIAIQGANDAICPPDTALDLHEVWDELELRIVMNGGHSMYDPVVAGEIVKALDRFGHYLKEAFD